MTDRKDLAQTGINCTAKDRTMRRSGRFVPRRFLNRRIVTMLQLIVVVSLALSQFGCLKAIVAIGYLVGGPPSIEPDFDALTGMSLTEEETTVAVVCYAPLELKYDFSEIDHELAKYVSFRLQGHEIQTVHYDFVRAWLDENADWDEPAEIGSALGVDYVIYIDLEKYSLYEEGSAELYRGRAEGLVSVFEVDEDGEGERIYTKEIHSKFPLLAPRATTEVSYPTFKRQYLTRLSEEIGRLFYEYYNGDDIPDST
jgi:hypothetical protein